MTWIICKILEGLMRDEIMKYLIENLLLYRYQHGFVPKKSVTNLLKNLDFLTGESFLGPHLYYTSDRLYFQAESTTKLSFMLTFQRFWQSSKTGKMQIASR